MKILQKLTVGLGLCITLGVTQAATVVCPGALGLDGGNPAINVTRQIQVTGALAGGYCDYQLGNFTGDNFSAYWGSDYSLIEKDVATEGTGGIGNLLFTANENRDAGTWGMGQNFWTEYDQMYLAFHFGGGGDSRDPDSFIVELERDALSGAWALIPPELANGLSNIYLIGRGDPECRENCGGGGDELPEPASVALVALALLGVGVTHRRQQRKTRAT